MTDSQTENQSNDDLVTVCASCLCASCWQGMFMCSEAATADVVDKTVAELRELNLESSDYWETK